jgi:heterotetrameric sarcosine oxidase gamma subunit
MTHRGRNCVPELIATSPLAGRAPLERAATTLAEAPFRQITSVAPLAGQGKALDKALKALGLAFPAPNRFVEAGPARLVWTGREQAFLIGADPVGLAPHAALTDQSDGWATLVLAGPLAEAVLARIVPIDVRGAVFPPGHAARVPFNHMSSVLLRTGPESFEVMVFRSMARTAWHEAETALSGLAARAAVI